LQIVQVDVTAEEKKEIQANMELTFTYEVVWKQTDVQFDKRFDRYLDPSFFQHRV
jgi:transmembrane 9 superfamily member 3